jgi:hypothetical protein
MIQAPEVQMKDAKDTLPREVLPIPDRKPVALTTYSAKDPSTRFPPIRQHVQRDGDAWRVWPPGDSRKPDLGHEAGSPVTYDYGPNGASAFSGHVNWVELDAGIAADDHNHLITPEERLRVAMAKQ